MSLRIPFPEDLTTQPTNLANRPTDTIMNNVLPAYADHLGPTSWVAPPSAISAVLFMDEPTVEDVKQADDLEELVARTHRQR